MSYEVKKNPSRGCVIEKFQPPTFLDIDIIKHALSENDEVVINIGSALQAYNPNLKDNKEAGQVIKAGERMDILDHVLRAEGVDPNRYIMVPIQSWETNSDWAADVKEQSPRFQRFYSRNFKNAVIMADYCGPDGIEVKTIDEQKPEVDYFRLLADSLKGDASASRMLRDYIPEEALARMEELGIFDRVNVLYNRKSIDFNKDYRQSRIFFLGGLQPVTGVYKDDNGHLGGAIKKGLTYREQMVIAIGSAQKSLSKDDPLTAGQRGELLRYALLQNGVDASRFFIVPVRNTEANGAFNKRILTLCPSFDSAIAGNDYTKKAYSTAGYEVFPLTRSTVKGTNTPISASRFREITFKTIRVNHSIDDAVSEATIREIEEKAKGMIDKHVFSMLRVLGYYDTMHFIELGVK